MAVRKRDLELGLYRRTTSEDWVPNARIRELCEVKNLDERIEGVLWWFGHVERM